MPRPGWLRLAAVAPAGDRVRQLRLAMETVKVACRHQVAARWTARERAGGEQLVERGEVRERPFEGRDLGLELTRVAVVARRRADLLAKQADAPTHERALASGRPGTLAGKWTLDARRHGGARGTAVDALREAFDEASQETRHRS
jgi:hypothetical protein